MMETWSEGWTKKHKGCGGMVQFVENIGPERGFGWYLYCAKCNQNLVEEDVLFKEGTNC